MSNERIAIFNEHYEKIGEENRDIVHQKGYWHETFQCWFYEKVGDQVFLYFQIRSNEKKDFPNLLDITAAGHLLANENVRDGIREVEEELGLPIEFDRLNPLGVFYDSIIMPPFLDHEFANVFLYEYNNSYESFTFQQEEVQGIVKADLEQLIEFWSNKRKKVKVEGVMLNTEGSKSINKMVQQEHFVPHEKSYYVNVLKRIKQHVR